ncbi:hypothetical protein [Mucilaginibacter ginkgonis]|uniref:PXPV repeat-containing protein n=1 Tax=Mucilaginibacter ginkgonis TaxID=2682091 RepID=A0A6I4HWL2_9SPHI|nr:hypothetical protein [Mucilaginibacter ginkgonis]QQL50034.1 hypothetical protein GO620_000860 [Mucilaginibacter ginkgonis]
MKRITFLALTAILLSVGAAKAQVGVHVGLNFGTPVYHRPYYRPVVVAPAPVYYEPAYRPVYGGYYRRPVYVRTRYYSRPAVVYHTRYYGRGYRRW